MKFAEKRKENRDALMKTEKEKISLKKLFLREKGICYLCGGTCDFEDVILIKGFLAAGSTFPAIDYIEASDQKIKSARLAHYCCLKQKEEKNV